MRDLILITGPTGTIGTELVKRLEQSGTKVRAGVRSPAKAKSRFGTAVELVSFDFEDAGSFECLKGVEKLFLLPPVMPNQVAVSNALVDAAKQAGVGRIVKLSVMGADSEPPFIFGQWHAAGERHIRESGIDFTFIRANSFMQNFITYFPPREGMIYLPWGHGKASWIDTFDIARVAAEILRSDEHSRKTYTVTGPAALGIEEVARILSQVAGRKITYVDVPESAAREAMVQAGLPGWQIDALMDLHATNRQSRWSQVTSDIKDLTGKTATSFEQFAQDYADRFR